jgi:hypothetical protein
MREAQTAARLAWDHGGQCGPIADAQPPEDPVEMQLDRPFGQHQFGRDLLVGQPLGHQRGHFALAG